MTARRRLIPDAEIRSVLNTLISYGIQIGTVDVRADGVTITPLVEPAPSTLPAESEYALWKKQDTYRGRSAHRPKAP